MDMTKNSGIINMNNGDAHSNIDNSKHTSPVVVIFIIGAIVVLVSYLLIQAGYPELIPNVFKSTFN